MIPEIKITNIYEGIPQQPIPLRLVPLITGWSVPRIMLPLSEPLDPGYYLLTAYEFISGQNIKEATIVIIRDLIEKIELENNKVKQLEILPPNYFVWSDDLAHTWVESMYEMEHPPYVTYSEFKLIWHPALGAYEQLIDECPDLSTLIPPQGEKRGRPVNPEIKERNKDICKKFKALLDDPKLNGNVSEAARRIAKAENNIFEHRHYLDIYNKHCPRK